MFIREKKIDCNNYREADIIPRTENAERTAKGKKGKKKKVTAPSQRDINDKNARRYLVQLGNGNFGKGDLHITCTYSTKNLPDSIEKAENNVCNYLRRIAYRRAKLGLSPLKYILVTEYGLDKDDAKIKRIHHHIIMNGGMLRDDLEMMWTNNRINWKKVKDEEYRQSIEQIGYVNADRIQTNENGIEALCKYITKDPKGKKRWSSSRNLVRPIEHPPADCKYSKRKIEMLAKSSDNGKKFFEKQFPAYDIKEIKAEYYDETGWHIYLKMWKKPQKQRGDRKNE